MIGAFLLAYDFLLFQKYEKREKCEKCATIHPVFRFSAQQNYKLILVFLGVFKKVVFLTWFFFIQAALILIYFCATRLINRIRNSWNTLTYDINFVTRGVLFFLRLAMFTHAGLGPGVDHAAESVIPFPPVNLEITVGDFPHSFPRILKDLVVFYLPQKRKNPGFVAKSTCIMFPKTSQTFCLFWLRSSVSEIIFWISRWDTFYYGFSITQFSHIQFPTPSKYLFPMFFLRPHWNNSATKIVPLHQKILLDHRG